MTEITQIIAVQSDTLNKMKAKSVLALSDSPSADGVNANMIKNAFVDPMWNGDDSIVGEIGRVCGQINSAFTIVKSAIEQNETNIQTNAGSIAKVEGLLEEAKSAINGEISDAKIQLSNNEENIQAVANRATALETRAASNEAKVTSLEGRATSLESDYASLLQKTNKLDEDIKNCAEKGDSINFSCSNGRLVITKG